MGNGGGGVRVGDSKRGNGWPGGMGTGVPGGNSWADDAARGATAGGAPELGAVRTLPCNE